VDSFGRIETFQWVTTNPSKKIFSRVTLSLKYHKSHLGLKFAFVSDLQKYYNIDFIFSQ
jgi:hypothetical protein